MSTEKSGSKGTKLRAGLVVENLAKYLQTEQLAEPMILSSTDCKSQILRNLLAPSALAHESWSHHLLKYLPFVTLT